MDAELFDWLRQWTPLRGVVCYARPFDLRHLVRLAVEAVWLRDPSRPAKWFTDLAQGLGVRVDLRPWERHKDATDALYTLTWQGLRCYDTTPTEAQVAAVKGDWP